MVPVIGIGKALDNGYSKTKKIKALKEDNAIPDFDGSSYSSGLAKIANELMVYTANNGTSGATSRFIPFVIGKPEKTANRISSFK